MTYNIKMGTYINILRGEYMDEVLIKDIDFKPLDNEELIKIFKTEYYIRNRRKAIKRIIVILELLIFFILAIIDPKLDKVLIPVTIDIIALTIEYFIWMISKYKKIIKHFDIDYFLYIQPYAL